MSFSIDAAVSGNHAVVVVHGEIDAHTAPALKERLLGLVDEGIDRAVVDMREVTFIESVGLGTLVAVRKRLRPSDKSLCLVLSDEQSVIRRTFEITRLDKVFPVHPDVESAVEDCLREPAA